MISKSNNLITDINAKKLLEEADLFTALARIEEETISLDEIEIKYGLGD